LIDVRNCHIKWKSSDFELVVVRGAPLNELEECVGTLVFDHVSEYVQRATPRKKCSQPVEVRNPLDVLTRDAILREYPRVYTALLCKREFEDRP
jgi:hypothetical protein